MTETPNTVHGRLLEAVHISGYTFERAYGELLWLLAEDRWRSVGGGYEDVRAFLATIDFSEFRAAVERRKEIAEQLHAIDVSQRDIGRLLGVNQSTISRGLAVTHPDANASPEIEIQGEITAAGPSPDANASPADQPVDAPGWFGVHTDPTVDAKRVAAAIVDALDADRPDLAAELADGDLRPTEARRQIKREQAAQQAAAFPSSTYRVIYADPPWHYGDTRAVEGYTQTAAADHYATLTVAELAALDVRALADADAVLFCWATFPLLDDALAVVKAWGFVYKTAFVWDKTRGAFGHYHTAAAELLLVATRGSGVPDVDRQEPQIQRIARDAHSAKPEAFRHLIDRLYTHGRRIELFRRGTAPEGWDVWGNEAVPDVG